MGEWQNGLFGCFNNCGICIITYFVPCVTAGQVAESVGKSCCLYGFLSMLGCIGIYTMAVVRTEIREQRGIEVSDQTDHPTSRSGEPEKEPVVCPAMCVLSFRRCQESPEAESLRRLPELVGGSTLNCLPFPPAVLVRFGTIDGDTGIVPTNIEKDDPTGVWKDWRNHECLWSWLPIRMVNKVSRNLSSKSNVAVNFDHR